MVLDDSLEFSIIYIVIDPLPFFLANTPTFYHTKPCHISDLHPKRFNLVCKLILSSRCASCNPLQIPVYVRSHERFSHIPLHVPLPYSKDGRPRIAIVTLYDSKRFTIGNRSALNKQQYARGHGYTVYVDNHFLNVQERRPSWFKVKAVLSHLDDFDWVMWVDADTLFMNFERSIEELLDVRYDMIVTEDRRGINAGVWIIQNTGTFCLRSGGSFLVC